MIGEAFAVATEFRFDVGEALLSTKALQGAVDDLSQSAQSAMGGLNYLASGLVAHLGFGSGGLLSVLTKAVQVSEAFNQSSLQFANNISSNIKVLAGTIGNFNDRLGTSEMIMDRISDTAIDIGVNAPDLARITQMIATPLANRGKLGTNYSGAINMSKNLMLGSEAVGLHPQVASESLYRALTDNMPLHGALFARLMNTSAFKQAHIGGQHQLMTMNQDKKIDLLNKGLEQLAGDADWLSYRLKSISVQFVVMKNQLEAALKPIGDALIKPIKQIMFGVNTYLRAHGKELGNTIAKLIGNIFEDPKQLFYGLMQLKNLGHDFKRAVDWSGIIITLLWVRKALMMIGVTFSGGLLRKGFGLLLEGIMMFGRLLLPAIRFVIGFIRPIIGEFVMVFAPLLFFFQIISRARAIAKLTDITNLLTLTPRFAAALLRIKTAFENIMLPINMAIDFWAKLIAPLFETSTWLKILLPVMEGFATVLEWTGMAVIYLTAAWSGLSYAIFGFIDDLMKMKNPFTNFGENFKTEYQDFLTKHMPGDPTRAVVNQVTNVGKIEARFDMREQLEPDRIAFAVTTHLKKLAMNPTQGRGQSHSSAFSGNQGFAGARG